ncbi:shikimate kinase [Calothrix parasitica NIES-267]|uniref:Shikimate kinase n=1 Tax=Calothrix parasitica NIES-267 TaxID=1973488 RepID=A0A1Z4LVQ9_9CYAN|nr:shikimate kinase [Calothrix parasitica NIES-267]
MKLPIVLIGSSNTYKTSVGKLIAEQLDLPFISLADISEQYYLKIGFSKTQQEQAWEENGADGFYRYIQPFNAYAIEKVVSEHQESVIEFAPEESVYDNDQLLEKIERILQPLTHVILLLYSSDIEESLRVIEESNTAIVNGMPINEHFVRYHSNHDLANYVVYTKDKTPEQTCEDVLSKVNPSDSDIILIGPEGTGKSTIGKLLSQKLNLPQVSMDEIRWEYYKEIGWDADTQKQIREQKGFAGVYRYWKRFLIYSLERLLSEYSNCVIDFGAGNSVYEDDGEFTRARELLSPYKNVVLLLPSPDLDESVEILKQRNKLTINSVEINRFFITHPSNQKLAKQVIYTKGKTPEEIKEEILCS